MHSADWGVRFLQYLLALLSVEGLGALQDAAKATHSVHFVARNVAEAEMRSRLVITSTKDGPSTASAASSVPPI